MLESFCCSTDIANSPIFLIGKGAFALHYALHKLDHYVHGAEFIIKTYHKPLNYLLESPMQNEKVHLWALGILGYNRKIDVVLDKLQYMNH
jgi:hypothetical protein